MQTQIVNIKKSGTSHLVGITGVEPAPLRTGT